MPHRSGHRNSDNDPALPHRTRQHKITPRSCGCGAFHHAGYVRLERRKPTGHDPAMPKRPEQRAPRVWWYVYLMRAKAQRIGMVQGEDEAEATAAAIKSYNIPPAYRAKVMVRRVRK